VSRASFVPELSGTPFRIPFSGRNGVPVTLCVLKAELRSGSVPPTPGQTPERGGTSIIVTTKKKKFRLRRAFITPVLQFRHDSINYLCTTVNKSVKKFRLGRSSVAPIIEFNFL